MNKQKGVIEWILIGALAVGMLTYMTVQEGTHPALKKESTAQPPHKPADQQ